MNKLSLDNLKPNSTIHMIGIGGISMSGLADILMYFGYKVTGSDMTETHITKKLRTQGAEIAIGQRAENIKNPDLVCFTAAIKQDNPELRAAKEKGIPLIERAALLGEIMKNYKFPLAVAGTHGKTTTTSMLSLILLEANTDPTVLVGGELPQINGNYRIGDNKYLVFEACEYVESFLNFHPFLSIITNIEEDHLDYFVNLSHIITSFEKFSRLNSPLGTIIVCSDDKNAPLVVQNIETKVQKYAIYDKNADFIAYDIENKAGGGCEYKIKHCGEYLMTVKLNVIGKHNVLNSLAAAAAAYSIGIAPEAIKNGLLNFHGTKRRFEKIGEFSGVDVMDDYAHHPTEIRSTLETARQLGKRRIWCIFQPHTYSRTKAFTDDFAKALSIADRVILADIYPAREKYDGSIHSCDLAAKIPGCTYINDFSAIERYIKANAEPGDLVITMGAGDIFKVGKAIIS